MQSDNPLCLVIAGHVDHGKSTLIGRLLHDVGALPEGKFEAIQAMCARRGMPFEWSFVLDALQTERDQGVTIDTTQIHFATPARRYVLIDAPGHKEFLKNMITGAAHAEAALLVVDAREGLREQTRRHAFLLHLLGVTQLAIAINKMDAVDFSAEIYDAVTQEMRSYCKELGMQVTHSIPVCARDGDNLAGPSVRTPFYNGPTLLEALDSLTSATPLMDRPLRLPIQDIYKFDERRILVGRIESGSLRVGDEVIFSPGNARSRIASLEAWPPATPRQQAEAGQSIGFTLADPVFVERGQILSHERNAPFLTTLFRARIFWLGQQPLAAERRYRLKMGTSEILAEVRQIESVIDTQSLRKSAATSVERGGVAEVIFRVRGLVAVDSYTEHFRTGRFVILEGYDIAGGGIVDLTGFTDQRVSHDAVKSQNLTPVTFEVTPAMRASGNGHSGGILWFTGLSGAGKTTLAQALQKKLFARGCQVFVLDGDNIRKGLCRDLGFSPEDRQENLRRAGEVAALFAQAGFIVITSFISPTAADRTIARAAAPEYFHSVYIKADLATCERRDVKGLYKKARAGEIAQFTGISAPYEEPDHPDIVIDTMEQDVEACANALLRYVQRQFIAPVQNAASAPASPHAMNWDI